MTDKSELHLFIIWNKALYKKDDICADIKENFHHSVGLDISWDSEMYVNNLQRFYLNRGKIITNKAKYIQKGEFHMILVIDENPRYETRKTTSGVQEVNVNIFELKKKYRLMTGGGHRIHGTDFKKETEHQVLLLLGKKYEEVKKQVQDSETHMLQPLQNPIWSFQIESMALLFQTLNEFSRYVVLRNYEGIRENYHDSEHNDIDILIDKEDFLVIRSLLNLTKVFQDRHRVHYKAYVNNQIIYFDFRFVGDKYYDTSWQSDILKNRQKYGNFYIPDPENYKFSLLYHALIHKKSLSDDYKGKLKELFSVDKVGELYILLARFMNEKKYNFREPQDHSVFFNTKDIYTYQNIKIRMSLFRMSQKTFRILREVFKRIVSLFTRKECVFCSKK